MTTYTKETDARAALTRGERLWDEDGDEWIFRDGVGGGWCFRGAVDWIAASPETVAGHLSIGLSTVRPEKPAHTDYDDKIRALAAHFGADPSTVTEVGCDEYTVESEPGTYRVMTDAEKAEAINEALESYLEDHILPQIPEHLQCYFDYDAWKRDVGCSGEEDAMIAPHDGNVHEVYTPELEERWHYVVRVS